MDKETSKQHGTGKQSNAWVPSKPTESWVRGNCTKIAAGSEDTPSAVAAPHLRGRLPEPPAVMGPANLGILNVGKHGDQDYILSERHR
jgi:hypothetical protein